MMRFGPCVAVAGVVAAVFSVVAAGVAAPSSTMKLQANLSAKQQKPPQVVKAPNASGQYTGTLVIGKDRGTLTSRLTFSRLSSDPTLAFIRLPKSGKQGQVVLQICRGKACKSGVEVTSILDVGVAKSLSARKGYVTIETKKNPKGEASSGLIVRR